MSTVSRLTCDVLVVGASLGGVAAALASARAGKTTLLLSQSSWLGGQMTSQGVCTPDENEWVETSGSTASYRNFRQRTRQYYQSKFVLSAAGKQSVQKNGYLQLGECWVNTGFSLLAKDGNNILRQLLDEHKVQVLLNTRITGVGLSADGSTIVSVSSQQPDGTLLTVDPLFVLDATDLGDLLPMTNVEHVLGAESQSQTKEADAPISGPQPTSIQPFTLPIALELRPQGEDHTIPKPANYDAVKQTQNFTLIDGIINGMFTGRPLPQNQGSGLAFWTYRRVVEAALFDAGASPAQGDVANINVGSNDYAGSVIPSGNAASDDTAIAAARNVSACYIYWLQTECPRDPGDGALKGYPNLRPMTEFWDTPDAIAPDPYIREGRRIQAITTIYEQDIVAEDGSHRDIQKGPRARLFADACGIGHYNIDIHMSKANGGGIFLSTKPYQIALGALVPVRITNLLPACKNIGTTHLTNGAYRLHPIEWNVGESAATLAAFCIDHKATPQAVTGNAKLVLDVQRLLVGAGVPIFWWSDVDSNHPAFCASQLLAVRGIFTGNGIDLRFSPDNILSQKEKTDLSQVSGVSASWPAGKLTRADGAIWLAKQLGLV